MMLYESMHFQVNDHFSEPPELPPRLSERRPSAPLTAPKGLRPYGKTINRANSYVVGQKLRESKWFDHDEMNIFCSVVETGFIVQRKTDEEEAKVFGVVVWTTGYEKSKNPEHIHIYSLRDHRGTPKVGHFTLQEFWPQNTLLKINNHTDKTDTPHTEDVIKKQVANAEKCKMKWHNCEHFTYWCRYGPPETPRTKHTSESVKGINFGLYAGFAMFRRIRRGSNQK